MKNRRNIIRSLASLLPQDLKFSMMRNSVKFKPEDVPSDLVIKIAETKEEFEQAYQILHDSYVEYGYSKPAANGMRILKYFSLPTTTTIVAKLGDRVIGTLTIIRQSPMGLPLDKEFDISHLSGPGKTVVEISSLAIASAYRNKRGVIFLPLCAYICQYVSNFIYADYVVISVNPAWVEFYKAILLFSPLSKTVVENYDFANGAPAVGLYLSGPDWLPNLKKVYEKKPVEKNIFRLFQETKTSYFRWPDRKFVKAMDPMFTPELLNYFFNVKSNVFRSLSEKEAGFLKLYYSTPEYSSVLPRTEQLFTRNSSRFLTSSTAISSTGVIVKVIDSSLTGIKILGNVPDDSFELKVKISENDFAQLSVVKAWEDSSRKIFGAKIVKSNSVWGEYIEYLNNDLNRTVAVA